MFDLTFCNFQPHEFDECRFDVSVHDCVWYLRADSPEERNRWVETLEAYKVYLSKISL